MVRQAKLGASGGVKVPVEEGLTSRLLPSVATATAEVKPNKSVEAYTGKHAGRRRDRNLRSLIQPRQHLTKQMVTRSLTRKPKQTDRFG